MPIEVIPTGAAAGAEIRGVNLAKSIDDPTFAEIERAYNEYGVIFFRDQRITPAQQVDFTRRFGEIEFNIFGERWNVPGSPEIVVVSNVTEGGQPMGVRRAGENWHSDMCYAARPPRGTMLYALEIPDLFGLPPRGHRVRQRCRGWMPCRSRFGSGSRVAAPSSILPDGSVRSRRPRPRSTAIRR